MHDDPVNANDDQPDADFRIDQLEQLIDKGDLDAARRAAETIRPRSDDARTAWQLARAFDLHLERPDDAERLYRAAAPANLDALVDLSLMLDEQGRADEAESILRSQPGEVEAEARVLRGRHYRAQDRPSRALREYERGVALGDMTALRYLAGTLSRLGRPAQAEQLYRHAPLGPDEHLSLDYADFLSERGRRDEAYKQLAALADRNSPVAERTLADLLAEDPQRDDEAVSHYLAAIMLGDKEAVTNLGVEWLEQGLIEEAEFALRHAWEDGDDLAGRSLGGLLIDTGHPVEGAAVMKEAATSAGAGTSTESKTQDCGNAIRLTVLPPFTVPERWRRAAAELLARRGEDALPASLPAWMTLLQAAQLSHLLARSASDGDVEEHLHRARWVDTA